MTQFTVTILPGDTAFDCHAGETILVAAQKRAGGAIPFGCESGGCGLCKIVVRAGTIARGKMSRAHVSLADEDAGLALACRSMPTSDVSIALGADHTNHK